MKHIVMLVDQLHTVGGIERLVTVKANYWTEVYNYKVTIVSTEQQQMPLAYPLSKNIQFVDLSINYKRDKSYFKGRNLLKFLKNIRSLKKLLRTLNPDFIIVASHIPITYVINYMKGNAKTIKEFHFTMSTQQKGFKSKIDDFVYRRYDFLAVLSAEEKNFYMTKNVVVLPNPLIEDLERSKVEREKEDKAIFMGRIVPVKNIESLIEIWGKFVKNYPNWILEIYGNYNNKYGTLLSEKIRDNQLDSFIILRGETKNTMLAIDEAKIMLLTSHQECFPLVILESLSRGVPVFSYDCPTGPRNILTDGFDGKLIQDKNQSQFVEALNVFAGKETIQSQYSKNALATADKYSLPTIMNLWNNLIFKNDTN